MYCHDNLTATRPWKHASDGASESALLSNQLNAITSVTVDLYGTHSVTTQAPQRSYHLTTLPNVAPANKNKVKFKMQQKPAVARPPKSLPRSYFSIFGQGQILCTGINSKKS